MMALPFAVLRALRRIRASDLVYINTTVVVADYLLAARLLPGHGIVHVHEIPEGAILTVLRGLIRWSRRQRGLQLARHAARLRAAAGCPRAGGL